MYEVRVYVTDRLFFRVLHSVSARESDAVVKFEELSSEVNLTMVEAERSDSTVGTTSHSVRQRLTRRSPAHNKSRMYQQKMDTLKAAFSEFYLNLVLVQNFQVSLVFLIWCSLFFWWPEREGRGGFSTSHLPQVACKQEKQRSI